MLVVVEVSLAALRRASSLQAIDRAIDKRDWRMSSAMKRRWRVVQWSLRVRCDLGWFVCGGVVGSCSQHLGSKELRVALAHRRL